MNRILVLLLCLVWAWGCKNPHPGFKKSREGVYYKIFRDEGAPSKPIQEGDYLKFHLAYFTASDSLLFSTWERNDTALIRVGVQNFEGDLYDALKLLHKGDSAHFYLSADSMFQVFWGLDLPNYVAPNSDLLFVIRVYDVLTKAELDRELEEKEAQKVRAHEEIMSNWMVKEGLNYKKTGTGLFIHLAKMGRGKPCVPGKKVKIEYSGSVLGGVEFDSSRDRGPLEFELGRGEVIPGLEEGVGEMREGDEAIILIPPRLGFGSRGSGELVPPDAILVFRVKVLQVRDTSGPQ